MAAQWEYCEVHVVYNGPVTEKLKAAVYFLGAAEVTSKQDAYHALMAWLGSEGWELVSSTLMQSPGMATPNKSIIHVFRRPAAA